MVRMRGSLSGKLVLSLTGNSGKESEDKCLFLRGPERKDCVYSEVGHEEPRHCDSKYIRWTWDTLWVNHFFANGISNSKGRFESQINNNWFGKKSLEHNIGIRFFFFELISSLNHHSSDAVSFFFSSRFGTLADRIAIRFWFGEETRESNERARETWCNDELFKSFRFPTSPPSVLCFPNFFFRRNLSRRFHIKMGWITSSFFLDFVLLLFLISLFPSFLAADSSGCMKWVIKSHVRAYLSTIYEWDSLLRLSGGEGEKEGKEEGVNRFKISK